MAAQCSLSSQAELPWPALEVDPEFPGTAVARLRAVHARVAELAATAGALDGPWDDVRLRLLRAGGLRDLPHARPGEGYTGHAFNDWNHCDLTTMLDDVAMNENRGQARAGRRAARAKGAAEGARATRKSHIRSPRNMNLASSGGRHRVRQPARPGDPRRLAARARARRLVVDLPDGLLGAAAAVSYTHLTLPTKRIV